MIKAKQPEAIEQGQRLKLFRKFLRMSQKEFGEKIGKSQALIQKYETGLTLIPWDVIKRISQEYDMSFTWFATGEGLKRNKEGNRTLSVDVAEVNTTIQMYEYRIKKLETTLSGLVRDFYAMKHHA
jgi:transcriptional regulator with XRE-family HTH domain